MSSSQTTATLSKNTEIAKSQIDAEIRRDELKLKSGTIGVFLGSNPITLIFLVTILLWVPVFLLPWVPESYRGNTTFADAWKLFCRRLQLY